MTLSSNSFEGSRPTYPTLALANMAQLVARAAGNAEVMYSIINFRPIFWLDSPFRPLSSKEKQKSVVTGTLFWAHTHVPRLLEEVMSLFGDSFDTLWSSQNKCYII